MREPTGDLISSLVEAGQGEVGLNRSEVEELLAKVDGEGVSNLSQEERAFLDRMSTG